MIVLCEEPEGRTTVVSFHGKIRYFKG